jgi:cullin-4
VLDGVMELFRYVYGKDVFQEYYKKDLAKRLLLKKSASIAAERDMVGRIKSECGATYTTKLEGMFKDMELSKQLRTEFNLQRDSKSSSSSSIISSSADFQMDVDVLAAGNWPEYQPSQATLPSQVTAMQEEFATFYVNKHQSRKLTFQPELSTCILTARFPKGKKELQVSAYQAAILHLFNESDTRTFKMIRDGSGIPLAHANVTLQSLCVMKKGEVPLLFRKSKSKGPLKDEEEFCLNMNYKNKLFRVTINTIQLRETKKEHKNTDERIEKNRRIAIMCAVVRVMKSRKQLSHQDLLAEVFPQLNFTTKARDVKMRIEDLIEREYLERDESDRNLYNYKA